MKSVQKDRQGIVLLTTLWIMVGLSVLALTLAATVRTEARLARASGDAEKACFYARGVLEAVLYQIAFSDPDPQKQGDLFPYGGGMNHYRMSNDQMVCHVAIRDEAGKLDLNAAEEETLGRLLQILRVPPPKADAIAKVIVDWRKPVVASGSSVGRPRPFRFVEELLLLPGVNREMLYGQPRWQRDGKVIYRRGLMDFLTVYSGTDKINPNYAEPEVLAALPGMSWAAAQSLVEARKGGLLDTTYLSSWASGEALPFLTTKPSKTFSLVATAWLNGSSSRRSLKVVARNVRRSKWGHQRLVWYDEYWPSPAVRRFSRESPLKRSVTRIHRIWDTWTS